jgi:hypothetical protein
VNALEIGGVLKEPAVCALDAFHTPPVLIPRFRVTDIVNPALSEFQDLDIQNVVNGLVTFVFNLFEPSIVKALPNILFVSVNVSTLFLCVLFCFVLQWEVCVFVRIIHKCNLKYLYSYLVCIIVCVLKCLYLCELVATSQVYVCTNSVVRTRTC